MALKVDLTDLRLKLSTGKPLSESEIEGLMEAAIAFRAGVAYLASCHAANLESLPRSASKSSRSRLVDICKISAELQDGKTQSIKFPADPEATKSRCMKAIADAEALLK